MQKILLSFLSQNVPTSHEVVCEVVAKSGPNEGRMYHRLSLTLICRAGPISGGSTENECTAACGVRWNCRNDYDDDELSTEMRRRRTSSFLCKMASLGKKHSKRTMQREKKERNGGNSSLTTTSKGNENRDSLH